MTLKEYLESQIKYWMESKDEFPQAHHLHQLYKGRAEAYRDILSICLPSTLNTQILEGVW